MKKRRYRCGSCGRVLSPAELRRDKRGDVCCAHCGSADVARYLTRLQRFCTFLLVSNFY